MHVPSSHVALAFSIFVLPVITGGEQMCFTCQYGTRMTPECINDPASWRGGDYRIRCRYDCVTNTIFNAESGKPTYVFRGCQDATKSNGCVRQGATQNCFYSCHGKDYCNSWSMDRPPVLNDKDGAASLTPLSPLGLLVNAVSLCALGLVRLAMR